MLRQRDVLDSSVTPPFPHNKSINLSELLRGQNQACLATVSSVLTVLNSDCYEAGKRIRRRAEELITHAGRDAMTCRRIFFAHSHVEIRGPICHVIRAVSWLAAGPSTIAWSTHSFGRIAKEGWFILQSGRIYRRNPR
jgi:hypothetical protein